MIFGDSKNDLRLNKRFHIFEIVLDKGYSLYIASWSKDKALPELRESLEIINKTAGGLIDDIDRHYAEIMKEHEAELIASEPAGTDERLFSVDDQYLHIQRTETGVDYTFYDKASLIEIDGGQLDLETTTLVEAAVEVCKFHEIGQNSPLQLTDIGILEKIQAAQDAAISIEPPVEEAPELPTDVSPDPAISAEARNAFGYTDDAMLPLVQSQKFSEKITQLMNSYYNGLITNEEVIKELLKTAQEITELYNNGKKLGLTQEELAFYDALTKPENIKDFYQNNELIDLTRELTEMLRKNRTIDWQKKETARASMRKMVKHLLKKYKYPPEDYDTAISTVISQCEMWTDNMVV